MGSNGPSTYPEKSFITGFERGSLADQNAMFKIGFEQVVAGVAIDEVIKMQRQNDVTVGEQ